VTTVRRHAKHKRHAVGAETWRRRNGGGGADMPAGDIIERARTLPRSMMILPFYADKKTASHILHVTSCVTVSPWRRCRTLAL